MTSILSAVRSLPVRLCNYGLTHKFLVGYALLLIFSLWPTRFASVYDAVPVEQIFDELVQQTTANVVGVKTAVQSQFEHLSNQSSIPFNSP